MSLLIVNAGSSSLRLRVLAGDDRVEADVHFEQRPDADDPEVAHFLRDVASRIDAIGHRVVHGGTRFSRPTVVDDDVLAALDDLTPLAPLHQPPALAAIRLVRELVPGAPNVACFDTAFHATMPAAAATYAVPELWRERWGLRRFGFHGLSHAYASRRAAALLDRRDARIIVCHLGAGASICATRGGASVDTTMGFTPAEGLVMATRSGSVDPGMLLWLITDGGVDPVDVERALRTESGLAGLAGGSGDMRDVLAGRAAGDERAALAFDVYIHRLVTSIAAMAAAAGGIDALVFTGGVGERAPAVRSEAVSELAFLGVAIDNGMNVAATSGGDTDITSGEAGVAATFVIEAREDLEIARGVRTVIASG